MREVTELPMARGEGAEAEAAWEPRGGGSISPVQLCSLECAGRPCGGRSGHHDLSPAGKGLGDGGSPRPSSRLSQESPVCALAGASSQSRGAHPQGPLSMAPLLAVSLALWLCEAVPWDRVKQKAHFTRPSSVAVVVFLKQNYYLVNSLSQIVLFLVPILNLHRNPPVTSS